MVQLQGEDSPLFNSLQSPQLRVCLYIEWVRLLLLLPALWWTFSLMQTFAVRDPYLRCRWAVHLRLARSPCRQIDRYPSKNPSLSRSQTGASLCCIH